MRVLQALYAWELTDSAQLPRTAKRLWDDLAVGSDERELAMPLIDTLDAHIDMIDAEIAAGATNWRLERLGVIERSVLRFALAELLRGDTPPKAVMQEAVLLAERFGSSQSARFVNGVLDALARRMGKLGTPR